jgi:hypothetical protein
LDGDPAAAGPWLQRVSRDRCAEDSARYNN